MPFVLPVKGITIYNIVELSNRAVIVLFKGKIRRIQGKSFKKIIQKYCKGMGSR